MIFDATDIAWHNGKLVKREKAAPSIASHSLHLGIGVFDGIMAYWNKDHYYIHRIEEHLERLRNGSRKMGMDFSWSNIDLKNGINLLLSNVSPNNYYIRPIVYRSCAQINVTGSSKMPVDIAIFGVTVERDIVKYLSCHISPYERVSSLAIPVSWKICGTYVNSYLVRRAAEASGYNDGIMLDRNGRITEASAANIFFISEGKLITPRLLPEVFPGITRYTLIDIAKSLDIELIERDIYPESISRFEGAFLASTLMELKPLSSIDNHMYNTLENPIFDQLINEFYKITHQ